MPTSIAHMIGGYAALEAGARSSPRRGIFFLVLVVIASNLPDLDFLPGALAGDAGLFHRGATHSLVAAVLVASAAGGLWGKRRGGFGWVAGLTFLAYASHLVLDTVVPDPTGNTAGVPLLWPVTSAEIGMPIPGLALLDPLRALHPSEIQGGYLRGLVSLSGVRIFLLDAALVTPLIPLAWGVRSLRSRARRRRAASASPLPLGVPVAVVEASSPPVLVRRHRGRSRVLVGTEARISGSPGARA